MVFIIVAAIASAVNAFNRLALYKVGNALPRRCRCQYIGRFIIILGWFWI